MISAPLVKYVLKAAVRDRLILGMMLLIVLAAALSVFLGSAAALEKASFVAVYAAGSIRILNVFGLALFVVFFIRRSFDARDVELMLARPVPRAGFILSYAAGLSLIAVAMAAVSCGLVLALSKSSLSAGHALWLLSLICENLIMVNVALFFSMVLTSAATASFATLGFYALARMMSQILGIIDAKSDFAGAQVLAIAMQGISMLMPRLDLIGQTSWIIYGPDPDIGAVFILLQGAIYTSLILAASCIDLHRRQF